MSYAPHVTTSALLLAVLFRATLVPPLPPVSPPIYQEFRLSGLPRGSRILTLSPNGETSITFLIMPALLLQILELPAPLFGRRLLPLLCFVCCLLQLGLQMK